MRYHFQCIFTGKIYKNYVKTATARLFASGNCFGTIFLNSLFISRKIDKQKIVKKIINSEFINRA